MGPGGVGWGPRPGPPPLGPFPAGPGQYFCGFVDCICGVLAACLSCLCCGWLFQDCCFGGPGNGPFGPPLPRGPPFGPPPAFPF